MVMKTVWYWQGNRHTDQGSRIDSPEINSHLYRQLVFGKVNKNIQRQKDSSPNSLEKVGQLHARLTMDYFLIPYSK